MNMNLIEEKFEAFYKMAKGMNNRVVRLMSLLCVGSMFALSAENPTPCEFVIAPKASITKSMSTNTLKEEVGRITKQIFDTTIQLGDLLGQSQSTISSLQKMILNSCHDDEVLKKILQANAEHVDVLGSMQQKTSQLQRKCSSIIEKLIDNQPPFKKASRKTLQDTFSLLSEVKQNITACSKILDKVNVVLKRKALTWEQCLKTLQSATKDLKKQLEALKKAVISCDANELLKNV